MRQQGRLETSDGFEAGDSEILKGWFGNERVKPRLRG